MPVQYTTYPNILLHTSYILQNCPDPHFIYISHFGCFCNVTYNSLFTYDTLSGSLVQEVSHLDKITIKTPNPKCCLYLCLKRVYRLEIRVSTEFRRHGIPSVFFTSVYSVFRAELAKLPAEFRRIPCRVIPRNSAEFHGIPWLFSCTEFRLCPKRHIYRHLPIYLVALHIALPPPLAITWFCQC